MNESFIDFKARITYEQQLGQQLWETGFVVYQGVPLSISEGYRQTTTSLRFSSEANMMLANIHRFSPLIRLFPGLNANFNNKTCEISFGPNVRIVLPEFIYTYRTKTLDVTEKASHAEGVFAHELGHHVHGYFTDSNHRTFLQRQRWSIREGQTLRTATLDDLRELIDKDDEDGFGMDWVLIGLEGKEGNRYRHSNPLEMVAEVFADQSYDLLSFALRERPSQEEIIARLLARFPNF